jgi:hypothetical protein
VGCSEGCDAIRIAEAYFLPRYASTTPVLFQFRGRIVLLFPSLVIPETTCRLIESAGGVEEGDIFIVGIHVCDSYLIKEENAVSSNL